MLHAGTSPVPQSSPSPPRGAGHARARPGPRERWPSVSKTEPIGLGTPPSRAPRLSLAECCRSPPAGEGRTQRGLKRRPWPPAGRDPGRTCGQGRGAGCGAAQAAWSLSGTRSGAPGPTRGTGSCSPKVIPAAHSVRGSSRLRGGTPGRPLARVPEQAADRPETHGVVHGPRQTRARRPPVEVGVQQGQIPRGGVCGRTDG